MVHEQLRLADDAQSLVVIADIEQADLDFEQVEAGISITLGLFLETLEHGWEVVALLFGVVAARGVGLDAAAEGTAQELPHGHAGGLAADVPQGNVDGAHGFEVGAFLAEVAGEGV